jgi:hypothetical protein
VDIDKHSDRLRTISTISYVGLVVWIPMLFATMMAFEGNGPASHLTRWLFVIFIWTTPIAAILGSRLAKKALSASHIKTAYCLAGIPTSILFLPLFYGIAMMMRGFFV